MIGASLLPHTLLALSTSSSQCSSAVCEAIMKHVAVSRLVAAYMFSNQHDVILLVIAIRCSVRIYPCSC